jgi:hypothetical protein
MTDLITLSNYKTAEGIQATKDDAKLELLITSVSQLVKTYCNATFVDYYTNAKTEMFNINYNESFVQLAEGPVVMSDGNKPVVSERDNITSSYTTITQDVDYYVDTELDCIYRMNKAWPKGPGAVKVVYKAGYATIPADLKLAVIDLITYYHKDEHKARQTIAGASIQNQSSSSQRNNVAFPDHIKRVLDLYKNF